MARMAFLDGPWPTMPVSDRISVVERFLDLLEEGLDATNLAWATEAGVPLTTAAAFGGGLSLSGRDSLRLAAELSFVEERDTAGGRVVVRREALGPVLAVMTYNGPTTEIGLSVIPSLLVGNPVIVKLPPECRMVGHFLADAADKAGFPEASSAFSPLTPTSANTSWLTKPWQASTSPAAPKSGVRSQP